MFRVGDKVLDLSNHIFEIEQIEDKSFGFGPESYCVWKPFYQYDFNDEYRAYVPVKSADEVLRHIMNKEEALELINELPTMETYANISPRERKNKFTKIARSGDRSEMLKVIKTLVCYRDQRLKENKPFSDYDKKLLETMSSLLFIEVTTVLNISMQSLFNIIHDKTGMIIKKG